MIIRDATPSDFPQLLRLNEESVHFLSPLTPERLALLHYEAAFHRVAIDDAGKLVAFLLAFREGTRYDSPNYLWFSKNYERFLYIDRIVVSSSCQGQGIGAMLYDALFAFAKQTQAIRVTCEFDIEPPNENSRRFHERYGFTEVGSQLVAAGKKRVSLQAVLLLSQAKPK